MNQHVDTGLLVVSNLRILYGKAIEAVRDVSLKIPQGQVVGLLGSNGAGKSTILKAISGILHFEDGEVEEGTISYQGRDLLAARPEEIVATGMIQVPEGRRLFATMTVNENIDLGGFTASARDRISNRELVLDLFPRLAEKRNAIAGYLSGGEQQMVAIGRALMGSPKLLMLDEPSLGLAPVIADQIFEAIDRLNRQIGLTVLLIEQNAERALGIAHYAYIMERGRVVLDGPAAKLASNADVREFYLGKSGAQQKSLRDIKHYKRRKRWLS